MSGFSRSLCFSVQQSRSSGASFFLHILLTSSNSIQITLGSMFYYFWRYLAMIRFLTFFVFITISSSFFWVTHLFCFVLCTYCSSFLPEYIIFPSFLFSILFQYGLACRFYLYFCLLLKFATYGLVLNYCLSYSYISNVLSTFLLVCNCNRWCHSCLFMFLKS